ncbi:MAG: type II toxin-antitoxin system PemK/MazF family toxin [Thermodesulfovibrionales bacterium]|nr:type II toxin-antitoxin system PemK/MazF family toxin [Thermodesulfovibrionales bacterium]
MIKGRIVLVPFPFDDLSASKVRPAVYLTNPIGPHSHVIVSFISSRIPSDLLETDLALDSTQEDFTKTGLRASSTVRLHRLITVTTALFLRELGELPSRMQDELDNRIRKLFNLK